MSLSSIVAGYQGGERPEEIHDSFPTVRLAQVYGAIAYYLENKEAIDEFIAEVNREFESTVRPLSERNPELYARMQACREQLRSKDK